MVDYKTGRHLLSTDDARSSMALALYALAAGRALRRPCHRVELHHLPTGEIIAWSHTEESLARHLRRARHVYRQRHASRMVFPQELKSLVALAGGLELCEWFYGFKPRLRLDRARHPLLMVVVLRKTA